MLRHAKINESSVRGVRKDSASKITTIPKSIVDSMHIQNADVLIWRIVANEVIISVQKRGAV